MATRLERRSSVMEYEQSVLFGQYHEKLATFARMQSQKQKLPHRRGHRSEEYPQSELRRRFLKTAMKFGNWPLLFFLGIFISFFSFLVDVSTHALVESRTFLMETFGDEEDGYSCYLIWTGHAVLLIMIAACTTRYISPQAAGSGVAEMKVIIRGVVIKEYLSARTLLAKLIGVPFMLAAGFGLGKEGPFVHISSMITNQLFKVFGKVTTLPNEYETRFQELITIAAAVGVAATFAAPIGSVLYSIEIVKSFFAVRSYWEGFFATTWGALLWRLFAVWFKLEENISHLLLTDFRKLYPYETLEIILFALLGILCGLISYLFVQFQRSIVLLNRRKNPVSRFLARFPLFYPLFISFLIASLKYPHGVAMFSSAHLAMEESMHEMFSNFTWHDFHFRHDSNDGNHAYPINSTNPSDHLYSFQSHIVHNWSSEHTNVFANTFLFFLSNFFTIAIASTVPVPGGLIVPLFMLGAPVGRFFGEVAAFIFPHGINPLNHSYGIVPGAYAVAASAALCGGITGSLSVAVIAFEITGQLTHFLPVIVCVLCSNLVSRYLGPTIYESTIELKNLPFLPTMIKASAVSHKVLVEDFMDTDVQFVWSGCTFHTLNNIVNSPNLLAFYPFVSAPESKYLLGIIHHLELKSLLDAQMSKSAFKKDKDDSQVSTNGRFQILSSFGPYRVAYTNKSVWEEKMNAIVDFSSCHIDPAPLQIMEGTPLSNIHNLFSLLSLQVVYVTSLGRLTGVVSLKDLRRVIESVEKGQLPSKSEFLMEAVKDSTIVEEEEEPLKTHEEEESNEQQEQEC